MHPALARQDHRPWPTPKREWAWRQSWCDLLFCHWPVPAARIRPLVPASLTVQEFDGTSWVGVVPFRMEGVMRRPFPDLPWISAFPELNVRVYVERDGIPGVWFLSLDATNPLAVWAARTFFHLPYHRATMALAPRESAFDYTSRRIVDPAFVFEATYRPTEEIRIARPGTLEHFLTERYCLYAKVATSVVARTEVHHVEWPLQRAEVEIRRNDMLRGFGIDVNGPPPLVHFAKRLDVVVWSPAICA